MREFADSRRDVVTHEAHTVCPVDAPFGRLVGLPDLDAGAVDGFDLRFASQDDDEVRFSVRD